MIQRRYRSIDGVELVADECGAEAAPVVVLLHGGGQTRHSWAGAMQSLVENGYRVISFDARGHGDSDWSETGAYSLDDRAADLEAITAGLGRPFALVGASLGGATAIHAVARGLRPAALVLVDIVPEPEPVGIDRIVAFMKAHSEGFGSLDEAAHAVAAYNPSRPRPDDPSGLMKNLRLRKNGRLYWHWDPRITSESPETHHAVVQRSARLVGRDTQLPVLLVRGLSSDVVSEAGVTSFRELVPRLQVAEVGGAGHMVAGDRNDAFGTSVSAFLAVHLPVVALA